MAVPCTYNDKSTTILTSPNKLFWSYNGIDGGKTGYNNKELQSLIATAIRDNMTLICIVLDSPEKSLYTDATSLLDAGFDSYRKSILVKMNDRLGTMSIDGNEINLISTENIFYVHPNGESFINDLKVSTNASLPVKKNKIAGTASYLLSDGSTIDVALYPESEITPSADFLTIAMDKLSENKDILYLIIFLTAIELILLFAKIVGLFLRKTRNT